MNNHITHRNGKSILIPTAQQLAQAIQALPAGVHSDPAELRRALAAEAGTDLTCPVTVQRLLIEFSQHGDVPYWRVVDASKPFAKRLSGGPERVRAMLEAER